MTNKHCADCGDPLFRHEGREFCPTCGREPGADAAAAAEDAGPADGGGAAPEPAGDEGGDAPDGGGAEATGRGETSGESVGAPGAAASTSQPTGGTVEDTQSSAAGAGPAPRAGGDRPADVDAAREALVRKLAALARQAEATDDVGRARELLAAAREAAEALAAVDAIRR